MPETAKLLALVENAAAPLPPYWPLRTFIAANPLQGLEHLPFEQAVAEGARRYGGAGYPTAAMARQALARGSLCPDVLAEVAARHGRPALAGRLLGAGVDDPAPAVPAAESVVNRHLIKWLALFLDEGQAAWPMPGRELGFYKAWRRMGAKDPSLPGAEALLSYPGDPARALLELTGSLSDAETEALFARHLAALPGWSSYVKWRAAEAGHPWREAAPIGLLDLVAARAVLADHLGEGLPAAVPTAAAQAAAAEGRIILEAWEETYRRRLAADLARAAAHPAKGPAAPSAQLVFCIDVRSEVFRRHLERTGPYETLGFAGFFGIPLAIQPHGEAHPFASCPVLLSPKHVVSEVPAPGQEHAAHAHLRGRERLKGAKGLLRSLKDSVAGAFAFVEASGLLFGLAMAGRTLAPAGFGRFVSTLADAVRPPTATAPQIHLHACAGHRDPIGLSPAEQAYYAEASLRIMGLTEGFAPLVVLCGHGGATVNNPFAAGLDCGACGGNRGGPNARVMAAILNDAGVRAALAQRGIFIPEETVFLAGEHNTTTDALVLYDSRAAEARHGALVARLRADLATARRLAATERAARMGGAADAVSMVEGRAADWAQVRPEWALARNAAFIVAHRDLTRGLDLQGRSFLHSYDWANDTDGKALEVILTAPMVVAEWINTQYYFSTVDNTAYGAGSKVTHTVVGAFGVMQGNGSDLMTGLPAQGVFRADGDPYHEPLRLMAVVEAPLARVDAVIARNGILQTLFGNGWVALQVLDPQTGRSLRRTREGAWVSAPKTPAPPVVGPVSATPASPPRELQTA